MRKTKMCSLLLVISMAVAAFACFSAPAMASGTSTNNATAASSSINTDLSSADWWNGGVAAEFAGGDGTSENPYQIATPAQLAYLAQLTAAEATAAEYNAAHYVLTADLYLNDPTALLDNWRSSFSWDYKTHTLSGDRTDFATLYSTNSGVHYSTPIATSGSFTGSFDGDGHTVYGFASYYYNVTGNHTSALIGSMGDGSSVSNLNMAYATVYRIKSGITSYSGNASYDNSGTGVICGTVFAGDVGASIDNCHVIFSNVYGSSCVGGIVGAVSGAVSVTDSTFDGNVSLLNVNAGANDDKKLEIGCFGVGGIIGAYAAKTTAHIEGCTVSGSVETRKYNKGSDNYTSHHVGGIVGNVAFKQHDDTQFRTEIINCINYADVTSRTDSGAGGITAVMSKSKTVGATGLYVVNCINYGNVTSSGSNAGGLVAAYGGIYNGDAPSYGIHAYNFANYGTITGTANVGQGVGVYGTGGNTDAAVVELHNCIFAGLATGGSKAGAVIGNAQTAKSFRYTADHLYYSGNSKAYGYQHSTFKNSFSGTPVIETVTTLDAVLSALNSNMSINELMTSHPTAWVKDATGFTGASIELGNSVAVNLYAQLDHLSLEGFGRLYVESDADISVIREAETVMLDRDGTAIECRRYRLSVDPAQIGDSFTFTLCRSSLNYGVETYASNKYGQGTEQLDQLLVAMMAYGDAARVNAGLEAKSLAAIGASFDVAAAYAALSLTPAEGTDDSFTAYALNLDGDIDLLLQVAADVALVRVSFHNSLGTHQTELPVSDGQVVYEGIVATALNLNYHLTALNADGEVLGEMDCNVSRLITSGIASNRWNDTEDALAQALACYMQACRYYTGLDTAAE